VFIKKKNKDGAGNDKGNGQSLDSESQKALSAALNEIPTPGAGAPGPAAVPGPDVSASSAAASNPNLRASLSNLPSADVLHQQKALAEGKVKDPYKTNIIFDLVLPLVLAGTMGCGYIMSIKQVKDKTEIYGRDADAVYHDIKDKSLASEKVLSEVQKMPPYQMFNEGENAKALAAAKDLIAKKPDDIRTMLCAGEIMIATGGKADQNKGLEYLAKAVENAQYSRYIRYVYAMGLAHLKKDAEAIEQLEKTVKLFDDQGPWSPPKKELAKLYMKTSRAADAVTVLENLLKTDPNEPGTQRMLGLALAQDSKQQEGFEEFQKGFTREQDLLGYPVAVKDLVDQHAGILDAAVRDTEKRLAKMPDDVKTMVTLARLYIGKGKIKDARDLLEKARTKREFDPEVREVLSEVMCRQNQSQSGFEEFRAAVNNWHLKD
jgi:predicted Zn-dependent protease